MKTGTLQRHRKHLYQVQINLKKGGEKTCIRAYYSFEEIQNVADELPFSSEGRSTFSSI